METISIVSIVISVLFGCMTWYYPTKKKRLIKTIEQEQLKIKTLQEYTSGTGYKIILRDCFHILSYSISICLIISGVTLVIFLYYPKPWIKLTMLNLTHLCERK